MRFVNGLFKSSSFLAVVALAACGGGGGGGGTGGPPPVTVANTSSPFYIPSKAGNRWVFNTGGSINDAGRFTTSCGGCAINGLATEGMDILDTTGAYSSTFYFAKSPSTQTTGTIDTLIGISSNHGASVTLVTDGAGNYGLPVNDSAAFVGEHWTNSGETSTITAVNGTQPYNAQIINSVNTDQFTGAQLALTWSFAKGVGFTSLSINGQTATLTSFTVDAVGSTSIARAPAGVRTVRAAGTMSGASAMSALRALL